MWGPRPAEAITDSIRQKGYARTFAPLAGMVLLLAGGAIYIAQSGIESRNRREEARNLHSAGQGVDPPKAKDLDSYRLSLARRIRMAREAEMKTSVPKGSQADEL